MRRDQLQYDAAHVCCDLSEWRGRTVRELWLECERQGAVVYWGFHSDAALDSVIVGV